MHCVTFWRLDDDTHHANKHTHQKRTVPTQRLDRRVDFFVCYDSHKDKSSNCWKKGLFANLFFFRLREFCHHERFHFFLFWNSGLYAVLWGDMMWETLSQFKHAFLWSTAHKSRTQNHSMQIRRTDIQITSKKADNKRKNGWKQRTSERERERECADVDKDKSSKNKQCKAFENGSCLLKYWI